MIGDDTIERITERLSRAAPEATIILFGSRARGDHHEGSDVDLLVVEPVVNGRRAEMCRLTDEIADICLQVDVLVTSAAVFKEWADEPGTVIHRAAKEGRVLYAPPTAH